MRMVMALTLAPLLIAQHPAMHKGMSHDDALKARGASVMGFDQDTTTHHFMVAAGGGSIEVTVKEETDERTLAAVRSHLRSVASEFGRGEFEKPLHIHGELPPGADVMKRNRRLISYRYEDVKNGGAVRIETSDRRSLDAVHSFLRYQIREHGEHGGNGLQHGATEERRQILDPRFFVSPC